MFHVKHVCRTDGEVAGLSSVPRETLAQVLENIFNPLILPTEVPINHVIGPSAI
jgi:hypothetical protein